CRPCGRHPEAVLDRVGTGALRHLRPGHGHVHASAVLLESDGVAALMPAWRLTPSALACRPGAAALLAGMGRLATAGPVLHWAVVVLTAVAPWWTLSVARDIIVGT